MKYNHISDYGKNKSRYIILKKLLEREKEFEKYHEIDKKRGLESEDRTFSYYTLQSIADSVPYDEDYGRIYSRDIRNLLKPFIDDKVVSLVRLECLDGGIVVDGVKINTKEILKREIDSLEEVFSFSSESNLK